MTVRHLALMAASGPFAAVAKPATQEISRPQRELTLEDLNAAVLATAGTRVGSVLKSPLI
jgi:hypothetical protein